MGPPIDGLFVGKILIEQPPIMMVPPWHVAITKLHELPTHPPIDRTRVLLNVMVVRSQEGVFQMRGALG
jgi:hypothetical protein